jgi:hypothetical protein
MMVAVVSYVKAMPALFSSKKWQGVGLGPELARDDPVNRPQPPCPFG